MSYLEQLRWPKGFVCPRCGEASEPYRSSRGRLMCRGCRYQGTVTAGTMFDKTRTPLRTWFAAAWYLTNQKHGVSALGLKRVLGLGSYQTSWTMLHRFRRAMVRPGRERLNGKVEVDETYVGIRDPSKPLKGARRKSHTLKTLGRDRDRDAGAEGVRSDQVATDSGGLRKVFAPLCVWGCRTRRNGCTPTGRRPTDPCPSTGTFTILACTWAPMTRRMSRCRGYIVWPRFSSAGFSAPTRARCSLPNSTTTWMNSHSGSTAAARVREDCCSIGCWSRPW